MSRKIDESMLVDFLAGNLNASDQAMVERWYDASEQNKKILEDIYYLIFIHDRLEAVEKVDVESYLRQFRKITAKKGAREKKKATFMWRRIISYGAAAAVLTGFIFSIVKVVIADHGFEELYSGGSVMEVTLSDGSTVRLQPDSRLTYPLKNSKGKQYEVTIEGEADFDVVKQPTDRRFNLKALEAIIVVRGTSFNVRARQDDNMITGILHSGAIDLIAGNNVVELFPGQHFFYNRHNGSINVSETVVEHTFEYEDLTRVFSVISDLYGCRILTEDASLGRIKYSGIVSVSDSLEHTLTIITLTTGTRFRMEGDTVYIYR